MQQYWATSLNQPEAHPDTVTILVHCTRPDHDATRFRPAPPVSPLPPITHRPRAPAALILTARGPKRKKSLFSPSLLLPISVALKLPRAPLLSPLRPPLMLHCCVAGGCRPVCPASPSECVPSSSHCLLWGGLQA
jgi:hypothetical protein